MKLLKILGRLVLGLIAFFLFANLTIFLWWRFGDWTERAVDDVQFVHETIQQHHPGPVDQENPAFAVKMEEAFEQAMALAQEAETPSDHRAALDAYTGTFNDGHLSVFTLLDLMDSITDSESGNPMSAPSSSVDIQNNRAWITITSFNERRTSIAEITLEIEAQADALRSLETIVFDVRGNSGGSSAFGNRIVNALWTADVVRDWVPVSAAGVDWRASAENAEHVHSIAKKNADRGRSSQAEAWSRVAEDIDAAVAAGDDFSRQQFTSRETPRSLPSPVSANVVVITDSKCASACLDFMDKLMALPDVIHIGEETSSDTQYIDVRPADLPSRTGRLVIPLKVYRDRLRPAGGTYVPAIEVATSDLDWDDVEALMAGMGEEG